MTKIVLFHPGPLADPVPSAVRMPDGSLYFDPAFPRVLEAFPELAGSPVLPALSGVLRALSDARLTPEGADRADLAERLFCQVHDGPPAGTRDVLTLLSVEDRPVPAESALLELLPTGGEARDRLLRDLSAKVRTISLVLRPEAGAPDPHGRADELDVVTLAATTSAQADGAARALERFGSVLRGIFGDTPWLNGDGLPDRASDLGILIASRATVEVDAPALREAARAVVACFDVPRGNVSPTLSRPGAELETALRALSAQAESAPPLPCTRRAVSPGAEVLLGKVFPVLDRGEVELVDYMGTDAEICRIARVSTGSERQDLGLLGYLVRHRHSSPVEFGQLVLRVRLPIFVDRQWRRHRSGSLAEADVACAPGATSPTEEDAFGTYSERSLRYQPPLTDAYVPPPEFVQARPSSSVKQGRGASLPPEEAAQVRNLIARSGERSASAYSLLAAGTDLPSASHFPAVAPELARSVLPLGTYTEWYWRIDAWNLMHWLRLRLSPHAQAEIRAYGQAVLSIFEAWLPALCAAFRTYVLMAETFSEKELAVLRLIVDVDADLRTGASVLASPGPAALLAEAGFSAGERAELTAKLDRLLGTSS